MEMDSRSREFSVREGRIILLRDDTEFHDKQEDDDLFDPAEDKDDENRGHTNSVDSGSGSAAGRSPGGPSTTNANHASPVSVTDSSPGRGTVDNEAAVRS